jgi:hypothetical protein
MRPARADVAAGVSIAAMDAPFGDQANATGDRPFDDNGRRAPPRRSVRTIPVPAAESANQAMRAPLGDQRG